MSLRQYYRILSQKKLQEADLIVQVQSPGKKPLTGSLSTISRPQ